MAISDATLFETSHGSVVLCADCGRFEITFLGERLRVSPSDFDAVAVTFSADELAALHDLLHGTQAMHELDTLLHDVLHP